MSSRFTRCYKVYTVHCREKTYVRFSCNTGGAMGINMVTKGVHNVIEFLTYDFPYMDVIGISGTGNHRLSIGGFNTHASKIMFDIFIATCQDPAQNMESSQGITMMKPLMGKIYKYLSLHHL
ncbi:hypothetical protein IGI04_029722 [Brassica rapa subsp. trilocularis]|uniref:Uncharacterized protein n=1 Tax=Brassica rapa subsp. trilocularis TaxID=1813537 RepID=A0ABQ7LR07_BRACM|nr:hypothetical protein IGI04_029722 [Brassica rapa subsp. trilocularis]